jgi:hypothetical protein
LWLAFVFSRNKLLGSRPSTRLCRNSKPLLCEESLSRQNIRNRSYDFSDCFLNIKFFFRWSDPTCVEFWPRILLYGVFPYIYILNSKKTWEIVQNRGWGLVWALIRFGRNFCFLTSVSSDLAIFGKVVTTITEYVEWILGTNMSTTTTIGHPWVSTYVVRVGPPVEAIISSKSRTYVRMFVRTWYFYHIRT